LIFKRSFVTFVLLLGLVLLLSLVADFSKKAALSELQISTQADLNRYILSMRQKLARYRDIPQLLSSHPDLVRALRSHANSNDLIRANLHLARVNKILETRDSYLMDSQGLTIAASNWHSQQSFIGRNFNYRPYFTKAISGELGQYFALGTTSKKRGFFYAYPVRYRSEILGVIVVKIDLNEIEQDWNQKNTELLVSDEDGVIFISTRKDWKFRTLKPLSRADIRRITASKRYAGEKFQPLNISHWQESGHNSQIITLKEPLASFKKPLANIKKSPTIEKEMPAGFKIPAVDIESPAKKSEQQYLVQSGVVGNSDLNVSILVNLETVQRQVLTNMLYVGTVYLAMVLLVMVIIARRRIAKQRNLFEMRELQALENSEARVKAIINNTWAGLITLDTKGAIETMNVTAEKLFGYSEQALKGQQLLSLIDDVDQALFRQQINPKLTSSGQTLIEGRAHCADERQIPIEFVVGKMQQLNELHFLVTVQDITERKQYEAQLDQSKQMLESRVEQRTQELTNANDRLLQEINQHSKTQNELIQTAKLAVIGQMSAGINHELNQPLMAIRGYADNARKYLQLNKKATVDNNLNEISLLTERMAKIIHPLKEFSRKSSGQQQTVSVTALRSGVLAILYPRLEQSPVTVSWPELSTELFVSGDLLRLEQVMVNLIDNAIQAVEGQLAAHVDIFARQINARQIQISVRDNGPGIAEHELAQIFEPFYTTKKEGQGLGLGLSISQRIIEDVAGHLSVRNYPSAEGQNTISGAEFIVILQIGEQQGAKQCIN